MDDVISRQATIDEIEERKNANGYRNVAVISELNRLEGYIMRLPSAQPETAKRIVGKSRDGMTLWYQCDMCNEPVDAQDNYCRGCGRKLTDG